MPKETLHLTHLAVDTTALIGGGWPRPSVDLTNVITTCNQLQIPVIVPELVLVETEAEWNRRTTEAVQKVARLTNELGRRLEGLLDAKAARWPSDEQLRQFYASSADKLSKGWSLLHPGVPDNIALRDAVVSSANHQSPFATGDTGFRDAIILLSILSAVPSGSVVGLLSEDKFFAETRISAFAKELGVQLFVLQSSEEAWKVVEDMARLTSLLKVFEKSEAQSQRILAALTEDRAALETYLHQNLMVPHRLDGGTVKEFHGFSIRGVANVHVPLPFQKSLRQQADATAEVAIVVFVTLEKFKTTPQRSVLGVGENDEDPAIKEHLPTFYSSFEEIDGTATVSLRVNWPNDDSELAKLEYVGVSFATAADRRLYNEALEKALAEGLNRPKKKPTFKPLTSRD